MTQYMGERGCDFTMKQCDCLTINHQTWGRSPTNSPTHIWDAYQKRMGAYQTSCTFMYDTKDPEIVQIIYNYDSACVETTVGPLGSPREMPGYIHP